MRCNGDAMNGKQIFTDLLTLIGEDPARDGLLNTPDRMQRAWGEWCSGYNTDIAKLLTTFDNDAGYNEMVTVRAIPFYSLCEHHLIPFFGTVDISYVPKDKIVGLSKLNRLVKAYSQRLQVQERMTQEIADALETHLAPVGIGVKVQARHLCVESRGIAQQGSFTITTALKGCYRNQEAKNEFLHS